MAKKAAAAPRTRLETTKTKKGSLALAPLSIDPSHDEIAQRAFALYLARGGEAGSDMHDWLRAERELRGQA